MTLTERIVTGVALFISLLALFVSITQTKVMMDQRSASVWPHISLGKGSSNNHFHMFVSNDGIGPAKISRFVYLYEDQKFERIQDLVNHLLDKKNLALSYSYSNVEKAGTVFRPGEEVKTLDIETDSLGITNYLNDEYKSKVEVIIEYCNIYDKCWRLENGEYSEL